MNGVFGLPIACPHCGGDVELVATGRTTTWATCGVIACTECRAEIVVRINLHGVESPSRRARPSEHRTGDNGAARRRLPREHGTDRGYNQHRHHNDLPACTACLHAHKIANKPHLAATSETSRSIDNGHMQLALEEAP